MTPENFCYWLQGVFEVVNPEGLSKEQLAVVKDHLQLVFIKKTTAVLIKPNEPNKNDDIFPSKGWEDYLKEIYSHPTCTTIGDKVLDRHTGQKLCSGQPPQFPFMFMNHDGTPVASC